MRALSKRRIQCSASAQNHDRPPSAVLVGSPDARNCRPSNCDRARSTSRHVILMAAARCSRTSRNSLQSAASSAPAPVALQAASADPAPSSLSRASASKVDTRTISRNNGPAALRRRVRTQLGYDSDRWLVLRLQGRTLPFAAAAEDRRAERRHNLVLSSCERLHSMKPVSGARRALNSF